MSSRGRGVVATEHPLASQAGATVLAEGGHAVDAAIAANAVMGVVCPMMCGVGGDLFAIVCESGGKTARRQRQRVGARSADARSAGSSGLDEHAAERRAFGDRTGRGRRLDASASSDLDACRSRACSSRPSRRRRGISGRRNHQRGMAQSGGVPARRSRGGDERFFPTDSRSDLGEIFRNPDLAWTYRQIAERGREGFYEGEVARRLVAGLARRGSTMAAADLANSRREWADPISTSYRGWDIFELPPNGAGIAALMMLNIMERSRLRENGPQFGRCAARDDRGEEAGVRRHAALCRRSEIRRRAGRGDAEQGLRARARASLIDASNAQSRVTAGAPSQAPSGCRERGGRHDVSGVVDRDGNMVSLIQSNFASFGSGVVAEGTGFALQNRGALFTLDRAHPNVLAPPQAAAPHDHPRVHVERKRRASPSASWAAGISRRRTPSSCRTSSITA